MESFDARTRWRYDPGMTNIYNPIAERQGEPLFVPFENLVGEPLFVTFLTQLTEMLDPRFWLLKKFQTFTLYSYRADTPIPNTFNPIWVIR